MAKKSDASSGLDTSSSKNQKKLSKIQLLYDKNPDLKLAVDQIEKMYGQGAIMPLGLDRAPSLDGISTGCLSLDLALGGRGIPRGRIPLTAILLRRVSRNTARQARRPFPA